jgi:hypothetical protein
LQLVSHCSCIDRAALDGIKCRCWKNDALLVENKAAASGLPASATRCLLARRIIPKAGPGFRIT